MDALRQFVRYDNGDRACVGSLRFDSAAEPRRVGSGHDRLYIWRRAKPKWCDKGRPSRSAARGLRAAVGWNALVGNPSGGSHASRSRSTTSKMVLMVTRGLGD